MSGIDTLLTLSKTLHQQVWPSADPAQFDQYFSHKFKAIAGKVQQDRAQWELFHQALHRSQLQLSIDVKDAIVQSDNRIMVISTWHFSDAYGCAQLAVESMMNYVFDGEQVEQVFYMWDIDLQTVTKKLESMPATATEALQKIKNQLTPREMQCFLYVVQGRTAKQIANELELSKRTVEEYLCHMKQKLGLAYLGDALTYAFKQGLMHIAPQLQDYAAEEVSYANA